MGAVTERTEYTNEVFDRRIGKTITYHTFGQISAEIDEAVDHIFGFTAISQIAIERTAWTWNPPQRTSPLQNATNTATNGSF